MPLIFVDCEAPLGVGAPSVGDMTEFGAVEFIKEPPFYGQTFHGRDCSQATFEAFAQWLAQWRERPVFVSDNPAYDFQWINYYCASPETKVLKADLSWESLGALLPGDELIAFEESVGGRGHPRPRVKASTVESTDEIKCPCYRVITDRGELMASIDHLILASQWRSTGKQIWKQAKDLVPGNRLSFFARPWGYDNSREAGELAGFFDGEGCVNRNGVSVAQNPGPTLDRILKILSEKDFSVRGPVPIGSSRTVSYTVAGGRAETLRFLGTIRPHRLLAKSRNLWENKNRWTEPPAIVMGIEFVGVQTVVPIKTTSGTLITNGFLSHNCWKYLGRNPFGHSGRRISDFYAGLVGNFHETQKWKRLRMTKHDHQPVHDAIGNCEAFGRLLKGER